MAEAVSLRRGTREDHGTFKGVVGEPTFDTTKNTLWVHDGGGKGYPLAREDCSNINTQNLGETIVNGHTGPNLMYANLSNIQIVASTDVDYIQNALSPLGYALDADVTTKLNGKLNTNLNNLTNAGRTTLNALVEENFVNKNLSNLSTDILAGEASGLPVTSKPMAYKDFSNITTASLASGRSGLDNDKNLAYSDLSNISSQISSTVIDTLFNNGIQKVSNLIAVDNATTNDQYPTAISVKEKFDSFKVLPEPNQYSPKNTVYAAFDYKWQYSVEITESGLTYAQGDLIRIGSLVANIEEVGEDGEIVSVVLQNEYGNTEINESDVPAETVIGAGSGAEFNITSSVSGSGNVNWSDLSDIRSEDIIFNNEMSGGGTYIEERDDTIDNTAVALRTLGLNQQDIETELSTKITVDDIPNMIINMEVEDSTGVVTVQTNKTPSRNPDIKSLIGGNYITGSWTTVSTRIKEFTPNDPDEILTQAWIVVL